MTPLRQRMLEDMGIRNLSVNTQLTYPADHRLRPALRLSPEELGLEQVRA